MHLEGQAQQHHKQQLSRDICRQLMRSRVRVCLCVCVCDELDELERLQSLGSGFAACMHVFGCTNSFSQVN